MEGNGTVRRNSVDEQLSGHNRVLFGTEPFKWTAPSIMVTCSGILIVQPRYVDNILALDFLLVFEACSNMICYNDSSSTFHPRSGSFLTFHQSPSARSIILSPSLFFPFCFGLPFPSRPTRFSHPQSMVPVSICSSTYKPAANLQLRP